MLNRRAWLLTSASLPLMTAPVLASTWPSAEELARRIEAVRATEIAFAATMAARDLAAFRRFLAPDTVFTQGKDEPLIGPEAVVAHWARYFEGPSAPFSWAPDVVMVLPSGELARSSGPVKDPAGQVVARFQSTWRRKPDGEWEIVFDFGTGPT
ncbi:YybH family protein [Inhella gelatinilytica]|uniref:Nuclear transport factor 2 family protein n=1 Tax=Inhella gelatinilytica TaxID=2795030 RepID=A0A931IWW4_9BURK|nr:nuclear transport factor 2 family protein [Inhella gelatinilytica]MBH9552133.1 nuclear transport factor 2 family protein [Inhella gelatinilytica]